MLMDRMKDVEFHTEHPSMIILNSCIACIIDPLVLLIIRLFQTDPPVTVWALLDRGSKNSWKTS